MPKRSTPNAGLFYATKQQRGSLLLLFLPLLFVFLVFILSGLKLALQMQNKVALQTRLDICAMRVISEREKLYASLAKANKTLTPIRYALYAARGIGSLAGPIGTGLASLGTEGLVAAAEAIVLWQNGEILKSTLEEAPLHSCRSTPFSKNLALCIYPNITPGSFVREKTLFPDVPGNLILPKESERLLEVRCESLFSQKLISQKISLEGSPTLSYASFLHHYE